MELGQRMLAFFKAESAQYASRVPASLIRHSVPSLSRALGPITLEVDQIAKINVHMAVSGATQEVSVSGDLQPILDTDNSRVATTFSASTIENIPLNGRNFSAVTQFMPGAINTQ